jgi:hypothetical protein
MASGEVVLTVMAGNSLPEAEDAGTDDAGADDAGAEDAGAEDAAAEDAGADEAAAEDAAELVEAALEAAAEVEEADDCVEDAVAVDFELHPVSTNDRTSPAEMAAERQRAVF